ncbi:MAG: DUF255 domain-containing protein [Deltaproteobacteria bacterium]|nr:DUF255 domain-containing protein [Deltaproteobacteria bacterium]
MEMGEKSGGKPNHLIHEKSPYLLKHAYNPVDWYPWGEEAIEKARREDKPIFLSIGYSTCHWCNVMEKESFANPEVARVMNENLVSIKLDREERPDIDKIYITAVSALTGSAGWPLNVFLTTDLLPFFGGTYFPPNARMGISGWVDIVSEIGRAWKNPDRKKQILSSSEEIASSLRQFLSGSGKEGDIAEQWIHRSFEAINASFDFRYGGFSKAPKFPVPVIHNFLLRYNAHTRSDRRHGESGKTALEISLFTLRKMADGGLFDHLGGGFHRYSTDDRWHLPHFEKMLYDNSQLARAYLEAYQLSGDGYFADVAEKTLGYITRDLTRGEGGFYSAEDADSLPPELAGQYPPDDMERIKEGAYYVWTKREILAILGDEKGEILCSRFGVEEDGNVRYDPTDEFSGRNVLFAALNEGQLAREFKRPDEEISEIVRSARVKLYEHRRERPKPLLDDKIITSWNGLTISALSVASQVLGEEKYRVAAEKGAEFIRRNLYDEQTGQLWRRWRDGFREIKGMADDYAFLTEGLIDLYEASLEVDYLHWAIRLSEEMISRFLDEPGGGFFMTEAGHDPNLIIRAKDEFDSVEPAPGSVAIMNLIRLFRYTEKQRFLDVAEKVLRYSGPIAKKNPGSVPYLLSAVICYYSPPLHVVVVGSPEEEAKTAQLLGPVRSTFFPSKTVLLRNDKAEGGRGKDLPFTADMVRVSGKPTVYVCTNYSCQPPATDPQEVSASIKSILAE